MKAILLLSLMAMLSTRIHCQQIGELDLGRQPRDPAEAREVNVMPVGCGVAPTVHGDGVIVNTDPDKRSKLKIELTLPKDKFKQGETVKSSILIQNVGTDAIVIPWSPDSNVSIRPKDVLSYAYDMGWLEPRLKGAGKIETPLESESQSHFLYSSVSTPGSSLSINPGEWVILKLRFLIDERRTSSVSVPIKTGDANIEVTWRQARFEWQADGCAVKTGYFSYEYQEDAKPIKIKVAE
jgi:hypothetical protein